MGNDEIEKTNSIDGREGNWKGGKRTFSRHDMNQQEAGN